MSHVNSEKALQWIVSFLEDHDIPYLICGGLAAIAYGATRPLYDIDLYVPDEYYPDVVAFGREYISYGPERLTSNLWCVEYVQFNYLGQKIEVGSDNDIQIYNAHEQSWNKKVLDFDDFRYISVLGIASRVMAKSSLIQYKHKLNRDVDIIDIEQINMANA